MSAQHTPGPWLLHHSTVYALNGRGLNRFSTLPQPGTLQEAELLANAHLIAAAPDLLAALQGFLSMYLDANASGDWGNWDAEQDKEVIAARAAITAATGEA